MCRLLVYKGRGILMSDLITRPDQSLIRQSYQARERKEPLNGDGFGIGWFEPDVDPEPCVFTSVTPAWSNRNLHRLAEKIRSSCFFAHVRAATLGSLVSEMNCHPFQYRRFLWMHNGSIADFGKIKRRLRESLGDEAYDLIQGTTDSEHAFAVFIDRLGERRDEYGGDQLCQAMRETIRQLEAWREQAGAAGASFYNFVVTDGRNIIATRYSSSPDREPASLYISRGERFEGGEGGYHMVSAEDDPHTVIIASEPLTEDRASWERIPPNHMVMVTPELQIRFYPIGLQPTTPG